MVRLEGFSERPTGKVLEHGSLHLQKSFAVEKFAERPDDPGTGKKSLPHLGVHQQVEVALTKTLLHVFQAMPFFRKRQKRF